MGCIIVGASAQRQVEYFKNALQNVTTDRMLHSVDLDNLDFHMALVAKAALVFCFWHKCRRRVAAIVITFFRGGSEGREKGQDGRHRTPSVHSR